MTVLCTSPRAHHGEPVVAATDDEGLDPGALELPAAFLYTIPTFQNPSGRTLSLERRQALASLARDGKVLVLEDDPYSLVRYEGEPLRSVYELAGGEGVVYSFSFSKIVAPGLRVGYLVGSTELIGRLEDLAVQTYLTPALLPQATAYEFVARGLLDSNVERVVGLLRERRDAMLAALESEMPEGASWSRPQGGYFTWLDFPRGDGCRRAADDGDRARSHLREGKRLLPVGRRRRCVGPARIQLRLARRGDRGRRSPRRGAPRAGSNAGRGLAEGAATPGPPGARRRSADEAPAAAAAGGRARLGGCSGRWDRETRAGGRTAPPCGSSSPRR